MQCARQFESKEHAKTLPSKMCRHCKKAFVKPVKLSTTQWSKRVLCSRECSYRDIDRNNKIGTAATGNSYNKGKPGWNKGLKGQFKHSEQTKQKLSDIHKARVAKGLCHLWKGGVTDLNKELRGCKPMRDWKKAVLERDDYTCQKCGKRGGKLNADHIEEFSTIRDKHSIKNYDQAKKCNEIWEIDNGQTLCVPCHQTKTKKFMVKNWKNQYTKMI